MMEILAQPPTSLTRPIRPDPSGPRWTTSLAHKLSSICGAAFLLASLLVFAKELLKEHIHCIQDGGAENPGVSEDALNSYCYISSTFTLPPAEMAEGPYPGVIAAASSVDRDEDARYHNYYQWIGYLLFAQGLSFFLPITLHA